MIDYSCLMVRSRRLAGIGMMLVALASLEALQAPASAAPPDASVEADRVLKAMSDYMASLQSFGVKYDVGVEIISTEAQKLQFSSSGDLVARRPDRLRVTRDTGFSKGELFVDGRTVSLVSRASNAYFQIDASGTIEQTMDLLRTSYGLDVAAADLLDAKPYDALVRGVKSQAYLGKAMVGGVICDHLAFRTDEIDWQIWVQDGPAKLPMKFVITTKWMAAAPQYSIQFREWSANIDAPDARFRFDPPPGAVRWKSVAVNELGEVYSGER